MNSNPRDSRAAPYNSFTCTRCGVILRWNVEGFCGKCLLQQTLRKGVSKTRKHDSFNGEISNEPIIFGFYRLIKILGNGGMGLVYEAEDTRSERQVALKIMGNEWPSPDAKKRFLREGRLAASLHHPHCVYVFDTGEIEGISFLSMELLPGETLSLRVQKQGRLSVRDAVDAILQVIDGLEAAYSIGIFHRDIKPSNCFIDHGGKVKIGDFGLSISDFNRGDSFITLSGNVVGTPEFSSPEQLRGERPCIESEIYSVGMTLYYLLTGKTAYPSGPVIQTLSRIVDPQEAIIFDFENQIPSDLRRIIIRTLAKKKEKRFHSYTELRKALMPFCSLKVEPAPVLLRLFAFAIDWMIVSIPNFLFIFWDGYIQMDYAPEILTMLTGVIYFGVMEGCYGGTWGKKLNHLRVVSIRNQKRICALEVFTRVFLFYLSNILLLACKIFPALSISSRDSMNVVFLKTLLELFFLSFLFFSMRRKNGFSTLYDLLTDTRVVYQASPQKLAVSPSSSSPLAPRQDLKKGPFHIVVDLTQNLEGWIIAYDPILDRNVWIRSYRVGEPSLSLRRKNLSRLGRSRWIQGVRTESEAWDVFEGVRGVGFYEFINQAQEWGLVRCCLRDLSQELEISLKERSLPAQLSLSQIWITDKGRTLFLDFPGPSIHPTSSPLEEECFEGPHRISLFLKRVAILMLFGKKEGSQRQTFDLPLPLSARDFLENLVHPLNDPTANTSHELNQLCEQVPDFSKLGVIRKLYQFLLAPLILGIPMLFLYFEITRTTAMLEIKPQTIAQFAEVIGKWEDWKKAVNYNDPEEEKALKSYTLDHYKESIHALRSIYRLIYLRFPCRTAVLVKSKVLVWLLEDPFPEKKEMLEVNGKLSQNTPLWQLIQKETILTKTTEKMVYVSTMIQEHQLEQFLVASLFLLWAMLRALMFILRPRDFSYGGVSGVFVSSNGKKAPWRSLLVRELLVIAPLISFAFLVQYQFAWALPIQIVFFEILILLTISFVIYNGTLDRYFHLKEVPQ